MPRDRGRVRPAVPVGNAGRRRPRSPRQEEIARVGRQARVGQQGGGLGQQLSRRVKSGAITTEQAQRTAQQRQTFKAAFGPDWRAKVFGDTGYAQRTRTALAKSPGNAQVGALNTQLMSRRQDLLEAAKKKLASGNNGAPMRRAGISAPRRRRPRAY